MMNKNNVLVKDKAITNTVLFMVNSVLKRNRFAFVALLVLVCSACTTTTGPVVVRDVSTVPVTTVPVTGGQQSSGVVNSGEEGKAKQAEAKDVVAKINPVYQDQPAKVIPLVEKLILRSDDALSQNKNEQAINLAEQGLRINRKEPRLYLLLSKAYKKMGNSKQSVFFAKQGAQYAQKNSGIYTDLRRLVN